MGKAYGILFEVAISHEYYNNKVCNDFDIIPTNETLLCIKNYRLLFKKKPDGFIILCPLNGDGSKPLIELDENTIFNFKLVLKNLALLNFTKLSSKTSSFDIYRFAGSSNPSELKLNTSAIEVRTVKSANFALNLDSKYDSVIIKVYNNSGDFIYQMDKQKTEDQKADPDFYLNIPINLEKRASGLYKFDIYENDNHANSLYYYISDELKKSKAFGIIEICNQKGNLLDINAPKSFKIEFESKKTQWHYFVQLKTDYTGSSIVMEDKTTSSSLGFLEYSGESEYKEGILLKFKSIDLNNSNIDYEIPFSETPLKKLEITISKKHADINIKNIANPSIHHIKSEVYIHI